MKKVINIFVVTVFLISFIGIQIHKHYSHGKLYSMAIFHEAESCCSNMMTCEMTKMATTHNHQQKNNCSCKDETETFKISNVFISERVSIPNASVLDLFFIQPFQMAKTIVSSEIFNKTFLNSLSPPVKTDIQSKFATFLC